MWGNFTGWLISGMIVAATLSALLIIDRAGRPSPPDAFGRDPASTAPLELPPGTAVVASMTQDVDPAGIYRRCIELAGNNRVAFEQFVRDGTAEKATSAAIDELVRLLREATPSRQALIFSASPEELVSYRSAKPSLAMLELAGKVANRRQLEHSRRQGSSDLADAQAAFSLGYKLFDERLTYEELEVGMRLMSEATALINAARQDVAVTSFDRARIALFKDRITPIASRIRSVDGSIIAANAGNVIYWSRYAGDRMWRVEAILALGRMRYFVGENGRAGDQKSAEKVLRSMADDPDRVIRTAVEAALNLTLAEYRLLR